MSGILERLRSLPKDETGQDLAEYAMLLGLIAFVVVGAVAALGGEIGDFFNDAKKDLEEAFSGGPR